MSRAVDSSWARAKDAPVPATEFKPGSNRRGDLSGADWRFLLPTLEFSRVLFLGLPSAGTISAFASAAQWVFVASTALDELQELERRVQARDLWNVKTIGVQGFEQLPFAEHSVDLIVSCGRESPNLQRHLKAIAEVERILSLGGMVYFETAGILDALFTHRWAERFSARGMGSPQHFWVLRRKGETRAALPLADVTQISRYLFNHVLYGISNEGKVLRRLAQQFIRFRVLHYLNSRRGVLLRRRQADNTASYAPFSYLTALGAETGINLERYRIGLFARGNYNSNKVAFFLFDRSEQIPQIIVKITRAPEFNSRLEAEHRSLVLLQKMSHVDPGTYPEALFLGHHRGLAILGERVVQGTPFRTRTTNNVDCPFARDAIDWITRLGMASADASAATPPEVSAWLMRLYTRFTKIYALPDAEKEFLKDQILALGRSRDSFPLVFQHGDAGTWNVFVTEAGRAAFLDWEASEPQGLPLWDLFYFIRSFGTWTARVRGERDKIKSYAANFLTASPFSALQAEATERYCSSVGVNAGFVKPLFYVCWMHRALKEASWTSLPLEKGNYISLLRLCIQQRDAEGLRWIFA